MKIQNVLYSYGSDKPSKEMPVSTKIANWTFLIGYVIVIATSIGVLALVLSNKKSRDDWFLVFIPLLLLLTGIIDCTGMIMTFYLDDFGTFYIALTSILNFVYIEAHWLF